MIYISDKAREKIARLRKECQLTDDYFLRIGIVGGGCSGLSYKLDFDNEEQPGDKAFTDNGVRLVTDVKSYIYLRDATLDFCDGSKKGFYFVNPNASSSCGCGESFAV
jgi:iron-sulfur cluster assembly protein